MDKSVIKSFLKRIELFKGLDDNQLQAVVDKITVENFPKNKNVFTENNTRENLSIIYEGEVELFKTSPYGGEKRLSIFGKYDFLGEGALMDDSPHSTSARATVNSVILRLSRDKFKELMVDHNDVAMDILIQNCKSYFKKNEFSEYPIGESCGTISIGKNQKRTRFTWRQGSAE